MAKLVKHILRIMVATALMAVIAGFTTFCILLIPYVQQRILKSITLRANDILTGSVSIGSVSTNLISAIDIYDIHLTDSVDTVNYLNVDHIRVNYLLPLLLRKEINIPVLTINGVQARCSIAPEGKFLFPALPEQHEVSYLQHTAVQKDTALWKVRVGRISIRNIRAEFNDLANHQTAVIKKATITASVPTLDSITVQLIVSQGSYSSPWWNGTLRNVDATVTFLPKRLKVSKVLVQSDHSQLVGKGLIPLNSNGLWDVGASFSSDIQAIPALFNNVRDLKPVGRAAGKAHWTGTLNQPILSLDVGAYHVEYKDIIVDTARVSARYDSASQLAGTITLSGEAGSVTTVLSGDIPRLFSTPEIGSYNFTTQLQHVVPEKITALKINFPEYLQGISLTSEFLVTGAGAASIPKTVTGKGAVTLPNLSGEAVLFEATWSVPALSLSISQKNNRLHGTCDYRSNQSISGSFDYSLVDFYDISSRFLKSPVKSGTAYGRIACKGTVQHPEFIADISGRSFSWRDARVDTLFAALHFSRDTAYVDTMYSFGKAQLDSLLDQYYDIDIKGITSIMVSGNGPLLAPNLSVSVDGKNIVYQSVVVDSCAATVRVANGDTVHLDDCIIILPDKTSHLRCSGVFSLASQSGITAVEIQTISNGELRHAGSLKVSGNRNGDSIFADLSLAQLALTPVSRFLPLKKTLSGVMSASGSLRGTINNPLINIDLKLTNPGYDRIALESCSVHGILSDSMLKATAAVALPNCSETMELYASIPFLPNSSWCLDTVGHRDFQITASGSNISPGVVTNIFDSTWYIDGTLSLDLSAHMVNRKPVLGGSVSLKSGIMVNDAQKISISTISAKASLSGSLIKPEVAVGITTGLIRVSGEQVNHLRFSGVATPTHLTITSGELFLADSGLVSLYGTFPLKPLDSLLLDTTSNLSYSIVRMPLQLLSSLMPGVSILGGTIQGEGSIALRNGEPEVHGYVSLSNGLAVIDEIEPKIGPASLRVLLSGDSIIVGKMETVWGKGTIKGQGTIVLRSDAPPLIAASCSGENLSWSLPEVVDGAIDRTALVWSTVNDRYIVSGTVTAGPCRYTEDIQIADFLSQLKKPASSLPSALPVDTVLQHIQMNISLDLQENLVIDMNLGYLKIDGSVSLTGSFADPSYTGVLKLTEGYVYYLDRRFTIDRASLTNYNPRTLNPHVDLEATSEVTAFNGGQMESYTVILTVSGNLDNPVVTLREKSGVLNQLEIVSILTFGQSTGGMSGDVKERLRTFVGQSVLGFGTRKLEQVFGIERIDLQGDVFGGKNAAASSRVTIAKRITPRLLVLYESAIGSLQKPKIATLFRITNNLFLSGERTSDGKAGVDLIFKYSR